VRETSTDRTSTPVLVAHVLGRVRVVVDTLVGSPEGAEDGPLRLGMGLDEVGERLHREFAHFARPDQPWMQKCWDLLVVRERS
jgi:hypothetical protein